MRFSFYKFYFPKSRKNVNIDIKWWILGQYWRNQEHNCYVENHTLSKNCKFTKYNCFICSSFPCNFNNLFALSSNNASHYMLGILGKRQVPVPTVELTHNKHTLLCSPHMTPTWLNDKFPFQGFKELLIFISSISTVLTEDGTIQNSLQRSYIQFCWSSFFAKVIQDVLFFM